MTAAVLDAPLVGRAEPRLFTPPLRELTPESSYGFEVVEFAREIGRPLLPWQEWAVIHGGELLEDGRPRFRILLLLVARQNGKTELPVILSVYWQFRKHVPLILGTSTQLSYAKKSWFRAVDLVRRTRALDGQHAAGRKWYRLTNGETESWTDDECHYLIAAANAEGGRSLTIDRGIADELRQHHSYEAWDAMEPACSPWDAQLWALSNAGDARSVVLNDLQDAARLFIETGEGDPRLGLLEWSSPRGADPEDVEALLQANPRVGRGLDLDVLLAAARRAKRLGGQALTGFKTERMCIRVRLLNPAIDWDAWLREARKAPIRDRSRLAWVFDVAPDNQHAGIYAAAVEASGRVRLDFVKEWRGPGCTDKLRKALPGMLARSKPRALGWLPVGPAAALAADMHEKPGWPPPGVTFEAIKADVPAVCMGFAELVTSGRVLHSNDPLLNSQVEAAEPDMRGNVWVFSRRGGGHVNMLYAAAGAAHVARTLPAPTQPIWVV